MENKIMQTCLKMSVRICLISALLKKTLILMAAAAALISLLLPQNSLVSAAPLSGRRKMPLSLQGKMPLSLQAAAPLSDRRKLQLREKSRPIGQGKASPYPDHNPALALDNQGNMYLVWERGNELWWAANRDGNWIICQKMPGQGGTRPVLIYDQNLSLEKGASSPDQTISEDDEDDDINRKPYGTLFCVWETLTYPKRLMGSIGSISESGGVSWSKPLQLTKDDYHDYRAALVADNAHHPLMLWLQRASLDDDADLYYQNITLKPIGWDQQQRPIGSDQTGLLPDAAPQVAHQEAVANQSPWVGQGGGLPEDPIEVVDPTSPQVTAGCVEIILAKLTLEFPTLIPIFGRGIGVELANFSCANSGFRPVQNPSFWTPLVLDELALDLELGSHLEVGLSLFSSGQAAIHKNPPADHSPVEQTIATYGGATDFTYLSHPIPLSIAGAWLGAFRIGQALAAGASVSLIKRPNNPQRPQELLIYLILEAGPEAVLNHFFGERIEGVATAEIAAELYLSLSSGPPIITQARAIHVTGELRAGGEWSALVGRYHKDYSLSESSRSIDPNSFPAFKKWFDPNSAQDPNSVQKAFRFSAAKPISVSSKKDKLIKTISSLTGEGDAPVSEMIEWVKEPLIGTGSRAEGKTVLADISDDIYNDGPPSVAKCQSSGEIIVVWTKALAASRLGTKLYAATYTEAEDKWSSPTEITPQVSFNHDPSVVFDSYGNPMVVWARASNEGLSYEESSIEKILDALGQTDLFYSRRIGGEWTAPAPLATLPGTDGQVSLAAGPCGEIAAVWINQTGKEFLLYGSLWTEASKQWSKPRSISRAIVAEHPLVIYQAKKPFVIWAQDSDGRLETSNDWRLYFSTLDGPTWHCQRLSLPDEQKRRRKRRLSLYLGER